MFSRSKNFIFIHIPKTGGNALSAALFRYSADKLWIGPNTMNDGVERFGVISEEMPTNSKHYPLQRYAEKLDASFVRDAFKFTIIRNPWDWEISRYFFSMAAMPYIEGRDAPVEPAFDAEQFKERIANLKPVRHWICGRREDGKSRPLHKHSMQLILRTETLQADYDTLASELGLAPVTLARRNVTYHRQYTEYYTPELRDLVGERHAEQIELFGYKFGD